MGISFTDLQPGQFAAASIEGGLPKLVRIWEDLRRLNKGGYGQKSYIIMANVPYPVDNDVFGLNLPYEHQLIAYVGIDAVDSGLR